MHPSAWPNQVHSSCHNDGDGNGEFSFFSLSLSLLFCSNFDFFKSLLTGRHKDFERQRELHFWALTMEAPLFASSYSSSPLYSCALTTWVLSSSSSLLFHCSSFCKTYYSAKFKSPRNLSIRTSRNSWVCGVHDEQKRKSGVLGLFWCGWVWKLWRETHGVISLSLIVLCCVFGETAPFDTVISQK